MCLLNAELKFPQSNDNTFFEKLVKAHKFFSPYSLIFILISPPLFFSFSSLTPYQKNRSNNHFGVDARSKTQFSVKHYASNVTYNIEGFMEKNTGW